MFLGQLEQLVLLAVLQLGDGAHAIDIRRKISREAGREVARGSLYAALQRLERKGYLAWETEDSTPARGGIPRRLFRVSPEGIAVLNDAHRAITNLSKGLEPLLTTP